MIIRKPNTGYYEALLSVQEIISRDFTKLLGDSRQRNIELLESWIEKIISEMKISFTGVSSEDLTRFFLDDMARYSVLTDYIDRTDVEEININSWDDIKVTYSNGKIESLDETFSGSEHAVDVLRRMLGESGMVIDKAQPIIVGHLRNNIRITAIGEGVIDKGRGISASIRIVNPKKLSKREFTENETATEEMLDLISVLYRYGVGICMTGATGSGKTTLMSYILETIEDRKRLVTIENGTREFDLVKRDESGRVINSVIHLNTRPSKTKDENIDMVKLLETALTINPDHLVVAEMKGSESFLAISAGNTGLGVLTTIHANSCKDTYHRMTTLSKQMYDIGDSTLMELATKAFPIVVFCRQLSTGERKITEITECTGTKDGVPIMKTLYRYIREEEDEDSLFVEEGHFVKENNLSEDLYDFLLAQGAKRSEIRRSV